MRRVGFAASFDEAEAKLGGMTRIWGAIWPAYEAIVTDPYAFEGASNDMFSVRFVVTQAAADVPMLMWVFTIDGDGSITFTHVEPYEGY